MKSLLTCCIILLSQIIFASNPFIAIEDCMASISAEKDTICVGETIQLSADNEADSYTWQPSGSIVGGTERNPIVSPTTTTTYTLTTITLEAELITNGDFEGGDTGFSSDYMLGNGGPFGTLSNEGTYGIGNNPADLHSNFPACTDHTSANGNMMVVNGASDPNAQVWCQTITVEPDTDYQFSAWATAMGTENPAQLQFSINGAVLGEIFGLPANPCTWNNFDEIWSSGSSTTAEICILNQNTAPSGNDFAIDDISFQQICISEATYTIEVSTPFVAITNSSPIDCNGNSGSAFALASGGIPPYSYAWSNGETTQEIMNIEDPDIAVTITDSYGCVDSTGMNIGQDPMLVLDETMITPTNCGLGNASITLFVGNLQSPFSYSLDNGPFVGDGSSVYTFENIGPGEHTVISMDANGCQNIFTFTIDTSEGPEVMITASPEDLCEIGNLILDAGAFTSYSWSTGATTQSIEIDSAGTYTVDIIDENDCPASAEIEVLPCSGWGIPNAFTPDGDGDNDTFGPVFQGQLEIIEFLIYDRWGNLVHDQPEAWDGMVNGKAHPSDVLIYHLVIDTPEDGEVVLKGDVSLLR